MRLIKTLFVFVLLATAAAAQPLVPLATDFRAAGTTSYNTAVPTPAEILGFELGARHTRPDEVVRYFEAVAAASDRVTLGEHGRTYQGRPLIHAIVTAPESQRGLEAIRTRNLRLVRDPGGVSDAELATMPVIAYMGYSVHGNEASGTDAAVLLLYHLAAGDGQAVENVLRDAVTIIDPMLNPDGRARFTEWVNAWRGPFHTRDAQDREHNEPWPGGRFNQYLFDLNRDWMPLQLRESRHRMELWHAWRPQLSTDFHEMGSEATYFFQPGIPSRNNPNTPDRNYELTAEIATYHARALDRIGQLYYTRESFDDYYYGKGSTYPDIMGSVGILFEQASSRGLERDTQHGRLHYAATVRNQFATSLSSLEASVAIRGDMLRLMRDFYAGRPAVVREARVGAYVLSRDPDPVRTGVLADLLGRHGIVTYELSQRMAVDGITFQPGQAVVVPAQQAEGRLLRALMERVFTFQDSLFYDVSTWTLPYAFGVPFAEYRGDPAGYLGARLAVGSASDGARLDGEAFRPNTTGRVHGGRASYAYLIPWGSHYSPRALNRLLSANVTVRMATAPFELQTAGTAQAFGRGTLVVPVGLDGSDTDAIHGLVAEIAESDYLDVYAVSSGLSVSGADLGSGSWRTLAPPRVALLAGPGTQATPVGEVWHYLAEHVQMPVSLVDLESLGGRDLSTYNVIILAGTVGRVPPPARDALEAWVRGGGTLVATGSAAGYVIGQEWISGTNRDAAADSTLLFNYEDRRAGVGAHVIGGSIFRVALDQTHPLAFGLAPEIAIFKDNTQAFEPLTVGSTTMDVARYVEAPLLSGYISDVNLERLSGAASIRAGRLGSGRVVVMDFNPNFRAFWWGTTGLLANAIFLGPIF